MQLCFTYNVGCLAHLVTEDCIVKLTTIFVRLLLSRSKRCSMTLSSKFDALIDLFNLIFQI